MWPFSPFLLFQNLSAWDFPGGPVVKASPSNAGGVVSIPGQWAKMPHALQPKQTNKPKKKKKKWKWPCNKFNKNLNKNIKKKTSTLDLLLSLLLVGDFNSVSPNFLLLPHIFLPASWLILSCFFEKKVKYPFLSGKFDGCYYQLFPFSIKPSFLKS